VQLRDDLSFGDLAWAEDGRQNVRDNNAAWVAGPSRICFSRSQLSVINSPLEPSGATGLAFLLIVGGLSVGDERLPFSKSNKGIAGWTSSTGI
jgi:hypothetical protein